MALNVILSPNNPHRVFLSAVADICFLLLDSIECRMIHGGVFCPQSYGFNIISEHFKFMLWLSRTA